MSVRLRSHELRIASLRAVSCVRSAIIGLLSIACVVGCQSYQGDAATVNLMLRGEYGLARARVAAAAPPNPSDRDFMLDRMKVITTALADGVHASVRNEAESLYDELRTQGVNADRTVAAFLVGEQGARIYKGEPFEQALAYYNVALVDGLDGQWGNVRAAANNSLFLLRDFSDAVQRGGGGEGLVEEKESLLREAAKADPNGATDRTDSIPVDYRTTASDFEIGYVLRAIASMAINERDDAKEALDTLDQIAPRLAGLTERIRRGGYNTVIVADFGVAPEKYGAGPSGAIAAFEPRTESGEEALVVRVGSSAERFPIVTDVNRISQSLKWQNLEDMRLAKAVLGDVLIVGGTVAIGASDKDDEGAKWAGVAAILAGIAMKATAHADTRHNELFPQRVYVALVNLSEGMQPVELEVEGVPGSRVVLPLVPGPRQGFLQMQYVRLPEAATEWASRGAIEYTNDVSGSRGPTLPYILGGRDVRTPSAEVLASYREAGLPPEITSVNDLIDLYKEEGINVVGWDSDERVGRHILEGGKSLYTPTPGSLAWPRLYGAVRYPYVPVSERVRALSAKMQALQSTRVSGTEPVNASQSE